MVFIKLLSGKKCISDNSVDQLSSSFMIASSTVYKDAC